MSEQQDERAKTQAPTTTSGVPLGGFRDVPGQPGAGRADQGEGEALAHETAETNTPDDTGSKVEPGRKEGQG